MRFTDSPVIDLQIGDAKLSIEQDNGSMHVGTSVWPCSLVLAKFVERCLLPPPPPQHPLSPYAHLLRFSGKRAIELGSGCGATGMALALLGLNDIILTDISPVMPALKRNLKRNRPTLKRGLKTAVLYWNKAEHLESAKPPFDIVVAADVVYIEESVPHLVSAMEALVAPAGIVLLGYQLRSPEAHRLFWELTERVFSIEKVPHEHLHPEYNYEETDIFVLRKR